LPLCTISFFVQKIGSIISDSLLMVVKKTLILLYIQCLAHNKCSIIGIISREQNLTQMNTSKTIPIKKCLRTGNVLLRASSP
jgi:hypothetical protein